MQVPVPGSFESVETNETAEEEAWRHTPFILCPPAFLLVSADQNDGRQIFTNLVVIRVKGI